MLEKIKSFAATDPAGPFILLMFIAVSGLFLFIPFRIWMLYQENVILEIRTDICNEHNGEYQDSYHGLTVCTTTDNNMFYIVEETGLVLIRGER